ncbi:MAG: DNA-directed RNA polymerase subunit omega [Sphingobacteriia bacterium]|nr:DNA-directed RNA polymerase subunit omega [Sphingobacteriia bacterium]
MARITVEDCAEVVDNRFELVVLAAQRAKAITSGSQILVERDNDKNAVVALREIGDKVIEVESLKEMAVQSFQKRLQRDLINDDEVDDNDEEALQMMESLSEELAEDMEQIVEEGDLDSDVTFDDDNLDVDD